VTVFIRNLFRVRLPYLILICSQRLSLYARVEEDMITGMSLFHDLPQVKPTYMVGRTLLPPDGYSSETFTFYQHDIAMKNTADMISGKPIAV
jgi:hypothetical protein